MTGSPPRRGTAWTRRRYDRIAPSYDRLERWLERRVYALWRERLWQAARGPRILEVGVGTGKNFPYHPRVTPVVAIDLSWRMLALAQRRAQHLDRPPLLVQMDLQRLAFADRAFDTVVGTFVIGSLPDPVAGLRELRRVTKPDGVLFLLEYVRPEDPLGILADLLNPVARWIYGAHVNRRTVEQLWQAGLTAAQIERHWCGMVVAIKAQP